MEALALAGLDADTALRGAPAACLSPPERACVVCGCPNLEVLRRADATGWTLSLEPPCQLAVFDKRCADCGTTHSYGRVVTRPALLVPVESVI